MNSFIWGIIGAATAVALEGLYKKVDWSWESMLPIIIPAQLLISYSIFQIVRAESVVAVSIFFSCGALISRLGVSFYFGDEISRATWFGFVLVALATGIKMAERINNQ